MMLVASEVEKLLLYAGGVGKAAVEVGDVETMCWPPSSGACMS